MDTTKLYGLLHKQNASTEDIAKEMGVGVATVIRHKKKFEEAKMEGTLDQLINMDKAVLAVVGDQLEIDTTELITGLSGLEKLQAEFQVTASLINVKIKHELMQNDLGAMNSVQLQTYTNILCDLQSAFFNKNTAIVNVQNNSYSGDGKVKYGEFLGDMPDVENN